MSKLLIGMVHVPPLPGSPRAALSMAALEERAVQEARLLHAAGFDGCIVENFGDSPFHKENVEVATVAAMARLVAAVCAAVPDWRVGVNVLRNDAVAAVSIAATCGAQFARINVHVGATATDQGILEGRAAATLRLRRTLDTTVEVWADVFVKHGRSLAHAKIEDEAEDAVKRGMADALIVSGSGTGKMVDVDELRRVVELGLGVPVLVGSGVHERSVMRCLELADGVIVGTSLKQDGQTTAALDPDRVARFVVAARSHRGT